MLESVVTILKVLARSTFNAHAEVAVSCPAIQSLDDHTPILHHGLHRPKRGV
jgi:hypothetical protein